MKEGRHTVDDSALAQTAAWAGGWKARMKYEGGETKKWEEGKDMALGSCLFGFFVLQFCLYFAVLCMFIFNIILEV